MSNSKRNKCQVCQRPVKTCLCEHISKVTSSKYWLVLRHKSELKHALNTVNLLELSLSNLTVLNGEDFSESAQLDEFISKGAALIWPSEKSQVLSNSGAFKEKTHFILIDGTWNKARKIYHLNPKLKELDHLVINSQDQSNYRIRKTNKEGGLSTLECVNTIGTTLDPSNDYSALTSLFNAMIDKQIECMGEEVFKKNYQERLGHDSE